MYKSIYMLFGYIFMGLGIAGFYLPLLPGVLFLILAAYCFMRCSPKYYNRIIIFIWSFSSISIFYFFESNMLIARGLSLFIAIISTIIVISANNE